MMAKRSATATKRNVQDAVHTKEFNKYCRSLERERVRVHPEHKHNRYDRIENQAAFEEGIELAFGKRSVLDVQKRAGKYRKVFNY